MLFDICDWYHNPPSIFVMLHNMSTIARCHSLINIFKTMMCHLNRREVARDPVRWNQKMIIIVPTCSASTVLAGGIDVLSFKIILCSIIPFLLCGWRDWKRHMICSEILRNLYSALLSDLVPSIQQWIGFSRQHDGRLSSGMQAQVISIIR